MTNAAIYFHPEGFETHRSDLKGRHVAGESFLNGFFRHSGLPSFTCHVDHPSLARLFAEMAARQAPGRPVNVVPTSTPERLAEAGCLFVPGPHLGDYAWRRRAVSQRTYSLCGVTHTTAESPHIFGSLLTAPIQKWDALICTSVAARASVEALLHPYAAYLAERFGAGHVPLPQLPVIPLGIDTDAFRFAEGARQGMRARLGIGESDVAVLFVGRLSFHAKAHPFPMYAALEQAVRRTGRRVHLIQAGWFANEHIESAFVNGARRHCPNVNAIFLDGREPSVRNAIWAAGDIFASLSDNIQETFGITPIEAMASGLPSVVTDWDGYRETIRDGVDGFRVPTLMAPPGTGMDIALHYDLGIDNYDLYVGRTAQLTSVDIDAASEAFARLIADPNLRRTMGETARARAIDVFDWKTVIRRYQDLWRAQGELRRQEAELAPATTTNTHPLRPDPFHMFQSYPTAVLTGADRLVRVPGATAAVLAEIAADPMNSTADGVISPADDLALALDAFAPPGRTVAEVLPLVPPDRQLRLGRSLVHLIKFGLLRRL